MIAPMAQLLAWLERRHHRATTRYVATHHRPDPRTAAATARRSKP